MNEVINQQIQPISYHNPNLSRYLDDVISKACSKDVNYRFQSCEEFESALGDTGYQNANKTRVFERPVNVPFGNEINRTVYQQPQKTFINDTRSDKKSNLTIIMLVIAVLMVSVAVVYFLFFNSSNDNLLIVKQNPVSGDVTKKPPENPPPSNTKQEQKNNEADEKEIKKTVSNTLDAWQNKNIEGFFGNLTSDYRYESIDGVKRTFNERRNKAYEIFAVNDFIYIETKNMTVEINGNEALVRYNQNYRSTKLNENSTVKKLFLRKVNSRWMIYKELSGFN
jgi:hypothetical protein